MSKRFKICLIFCTLLVSISSCGLINKASSNAEMNTEAVKSDWRVHLNFKDQKLSSKVRLEAIQNECIYLSVRPFPFVELARLWFTPNEVCFVDLMEHRYARFDYSLLPQIGEQSLNFTLISKHLFQELKARPLNDEYKCLKFGQGQGLSYRLLSVDFLSSKDELSLEPRIKEGYRPVDPREVLAFLKQILAL